MNSQLPPYMREAADPSTPPARLAEIAATYPDAQATIALNPTCYPGLLEWIGQVGDPTAKAAVAQVRSSQAGAPGVPGSTPAAPVAPAGAVTPGVGAPFSAQPAAANPQFGQAAQPQQPAQPYQQVQPTQPLQQAQQAQQAQPYQQTQPTQPYQQVQPTQLTQPTQQLPQGYQFQQPQPGGPGAVPPLGTVPPTPPTAGKRKRGLMIGLIAGALVLLLGGGIAYALVFSKLGGASSPEGAADKLLNSVSSFDSIGVYGSLAPSEIEAFKPSLDTLQQTEVSDKDKQQQVTKLFEDITKSAEIKFTDVKYATEEIDEGIELVTVTDGNLEITGDADKLTDAIVELATIQDEMSGSSSMFYDEDETREEVQQFLDDELPYELSVSEISDELGFDPVFVTVKEGSGWYVSPMLTGAEYAYQSQSSLGQEDRGKMPDASDVKKYDTPEAAAEGLTDAIVNTIETADTRELAASLPLAERRLVAIYGPPLLADASGIPLDAEIDPGFSSKIEGDTAEVDFKDFNITASGGFSDDEVSVSITGICAESDSEYGSDRYCLSDSEFKPVSKLGVKDWHLTAVKEDGGWFLSPVTSAADISAIVATKIREHSEDGTLDELFG